MLTLASRLLPAFALALLSAIAAPAASAAPAVPAPTATMVRPSEAEALAFIKAYSPSDLRREVELRTLRTDFLPGMRRNPDVALMLDAYPDLGPALIAAMTPHIDLYMAEYDERFFPRATAIVRDSLSREDVLKLTAFYQSSQGRKMLATASTKVDATEVAEQASKGKAIDSDVLKRQALRTGLATIATLTPAERAALVAMVTSPTGQRFKALSPKLMALQAELTSQPGPRFSAAAKATMGAAFKAVTGVDPITP